MHRSGEPLQTGWPRIDGLMEALFKGRKYWTVQGHGNKTDQGSVGEQRRSAKGLRGCRQLPRACLPCLSCVLVDACVCAPTTGELSPIEGEWNDILGAFFA